jgi:hypothetical protein
MIEGMHDMDMDTGVEDASLDRLDRLRTRFLDRLEDMLERPSLRPREVIAAGRLVTKLGDQEQARARSGERH